MPLDPDIAAAAEMMSEMELPSMEELGPEMARELFDSAPMPEPEDVFEVEDRTIASIPVRVYHPTESPSGVVLFFHGGGWVTSSIAGHDSMARRIAIRSNATLVSVGYRLAPEHPFPAAHDDCWSVVRAVADGDEWELGSDRLAVCGDSAGGNLAATVALRARDEGVSVALQALLYPCIDDRQIDYRSMAVHGDGPFLSAETMRWFWDQYVPADLRSVPYAVPAREVVFEGVAPAFVATAEYDPLCDEGVRYAERLQDAGVAVELRAYPGVVHGFMSAWHVSSRAEVAHDDLAAALRRALG